MPAALVTGTFNPPHMGHVKLIKAAIEKRDHVVVVVLAAPHDRLAANDRARALLQDCVAEGDNEAEGLADGDSDGLSDGEMDGDNEGERDGDNEADGD